jgi:hypothetical protein
MCTIHPHRCRRRATRHVTAPHDVRGLTNDVNLLRGISTHRARDDEIVRVPFQDVRQMSILHTRDFCYLGSRVQEWTPRSDRRQVLQESKGHPRGQPTRSLSKSCGGDGGLRTILLAPQPSKLNMMIRYSVNVGNLCSCFHATYLLISPHYFSRPLQHSYAHTEI